MKQIQEKLGISKEITESNKQESKREIFNSILNKLDLLKDKNSRINFYIDELFDSLSLNE